MTTVKVRILREKESGPYRIRGKVISTLDITYSTETLAPEVIRLPLETATPDEKMKHLKMAIGARLGLLPEEIEIEFEGE